MRAAVITKHGGPEVFAIQERPDVAPGRGEVGIDVRAIGINFADTMARVGLYADAPKPPMVVGYEVAGLVDVVGEGVEDVAVGDRVMAGTRFGGYASRVVTPVGNVIPLPESLSFEQGAAVPVNYATAWAGLNEYGAVGPGDRVLVHAAGGGVGIAATQIAKGAGAEVWGTASPGKHEAIRGFGVDHAMGYEDKLPKGSFDYVLDALGGPSFRRSYKALKPGGRLVAYGASAVMSGETRNLKAALTTAVRMPRFNLIKQMSESKAVIGLNMLTLWDDRGTFSGWSDSLRALIDEGVISPVVAQAFPLDQAGEAHRFIAERRNVGKVVLTP